MIEFEKVKAQLSKYEKMLQLDNNLTTGENERRASSFLVAQSIIAEWRHILGEEKIKYLSVQNAVYAKELAKGEAKTVTENKITVEASKAYIEARENLEIVENNLTFLKTYGDIFSNAHLFYRQMCKENSFL